MMSLSQTYLSVHSWIVNEMVNYWELWKCNSCSIRFTLSHMHRHSAAQSINTIEEKSNAQCMRNANDYSETNNQREHDEITTRLGILTLHRRSIHSAQKQPYRYLQSACNSLLQSQGYQMKTSASLNGSLKAQAGLNFLICIGFHSKMVPLIWPYAIFVLL